MKLYRTPYHIGLPYRNDQLMAVLAGQPPMPFDPIDQTRFSNERIGARMEFHVNGDQIIGFQLRLGENIHRYEKRKLIMRPVYSPAQSIP